MRDLASALRELFCMALELATLALFLCAIAALIAR